MLTIELLNYDRLCGFLLLSVPNQEASLWTTDELIVDVGATD